MFLTSGSTYDEAISLLDDICQREISEVRNSIPRIGSPGFPVMMQVALNKYGAWTEQAGRRLRAVFGAGEIASRLRGEKYWIIIASNPESSRTVSMLHTELNELTMAYMYAANELRSLKARLPSGLGRCLVLDTNDFLHFQRFVDIPWSRLYGKGAWVVVPHVVLDEIDRKSYQEGVKMRRRARKVYHDFEYILDHADANGYAKLTDGTLCMILTDEPGHQRLPNNDDEIVARAKFLQQGLPPGTVTIITGDIGMRARALAQHLQAEKLPDNFQIQEGDAAEESSPSGNAHSTALAADPADPGGGSK
jgi:PIN domain